MHMDQDGNKYLDIGDHIQPFSFNISEQYYATARPQVKMDGICIPTVYIYKYDYNSNIEIAYLYENGIWYIPQTPPNNILQGVINGIKEVDENYRLCR